MEQFFKEKQQPNSQIPTQDSSLGSNTTGLSSTPQNESIFEEVKNDRENLGEIDVQGFDQSLAALFDENNYGENQWQQRPFGHNFLEREEEHNDDQYGQDEQLLQQQQQQQNTILPSQNSLHEQLNNNNNFFLHVQGLDAYFDENNYGENQWQQRSFAHNFLEREEEHNDDQYGQEEQLLQQQQQQQNTILQSQNSLYELNQGRPSDFGSDQGLDSIGQAQIQDFFSPYDNHYNNNYYLLQNHSNPVNDQQIQSTQNQELNSSNTTCQQRNQRSSKQDELVQKMSDMINQELNFNELRKFNNSIKKNTIRTILQKCNKNINQEILRQFLENKLTDNKVLSTYNRLNDIYMQLFPDNLNMRREVFIAFTQLYNEDRTKYNYGNVKYLFQDARNNQQIIIQQIKIVKMKVKRSHDHILLLITCAQQIFREFFSQFLEQQLIPYLYSEYKHNTYPNKKYNSMKYRYLDIYSTLYWVDTLFVKNM